MSNQVSRRTLSKLCMAAFYGVVAGSLQSSCSREEEPQPAASTPPLDPDENPLLSGPHVCRGLNTCAGEGADGQNECAGRGSCATANEHLCHALNECRGQGGCGSTAGENSCKGTGECGVPLSEKTWDKTRTRFESTWREAGREFGEAPAAGG